MMKAWIAGLAMVAVCGTGWGQGAPAGDQVRTFRFHKLTDVRGMNEVTATVKGLVDPETKVLQVDAENAIVVRGSAAQVELAGRLIAELDEPKTTNAAETVRTFSMHHVTDPADLNGVSTALRNLLDPQVKVYFVPAENAIVVQGDAEQLELAQRLLTELDKPKKSYRVRYTITDVDGEKTVGVQHFSLVVVSGEKTTLKNGSKVPVVTGSFHDGNSGTQTQMTYLDVGLNIDAKIYESSDEVRLESKVERSEVAQEPSGAGAQDPIVRQAVLQGTARMALDKPVMLGSVDVPGSMRHLDIGVVMELVK